MTDHKTGEKTELKLVTNPPTPNDIYKAILSSITNVADVRMQKNTVPILYLTEIGKMLDEMARNAAQSMMGMFGEIYDHYDPLAKLKSD